MILQTGHIFSKTSAKAFREWIVLIVIANYNCKIRLKVQWPLEWVQQVSMNCAVKNASESNESSTFLPV